MTRFPLDSGMCVCVGDSKTPVGVGDRVEEGGQELVEPYCWLRSLQVGWFDFYEAATFLPDGVWGDEWVGSDTGSRMGRVGESQEEALN